MRDFTGKICPFCKTAFKPDDEVVICSECDMPHHKDCWIENQGCTTFGCQGTIQSPESTADHTENRIQNTKRIVFCTQCGARNANTSLFCLKCGNRLVSASPSHAPVYQQSDPDNTDPYSYVNQPGTPYRPNMYANNTYTDLDIQPLVGSNEAYYMQKFREMKIQNKTISWNWAPFLIAPYWLIYRKMYAYGAAAFVIFFLLSLMDTAIGSLLAVCCYVAMGLYGNYIYMRFLENKAEQMRAMNEQYKMQFIANNSGVNTAAAILSVVVYAVLKVIITL